MYFSTNIANGNISADCTYYLAKADWKYLTLIWLSNLFLTVGNNSIQPKGCEYLKNANWPFLRNIDLSIPQ